jgi:hypothetical protein
VAIRVVHEQAWQALMHMRPGEAQRLWGVTVRRPGEWTWEVGGEAARLLLPAIDALMVRAGFEPVQAI